MCRIATRLKRQINQLKKDKLIAIGGGKSHSRLDEDLDVLIEENFNLQEEERKLVVQVKKLQQKKVQSITVTQEQVKKLAHTMQGVSPGKASKTVVEHSHRGGNNHGEFLLDLENMRANIE